MNLEEPYIYDKGVRITVESFCRKKNISYLAVKVVKKQNPSLTWYSATQKVLNLSTPSRHRLPPKPIYLSKPPDPPKPPKPLKPTYVIKFKNAWRNMKTRCQNPNCNVYKYYGGRGIKVCERWLDSFENFKEDMYDSYLEHIKEYGENQTTLDRIDVNGDYEPNNCRWATYKVQANNTRPQSLYNTDINLTQKCREYGVDCKEVVKKLNEGYALDEAMIETKLEEENKNTY